MSLETGGTSATYLQDSGGKLLSSCTGGVLQNYATDRLGSVTATTNNTSGGLTNTYRYDPRDMLVGFTGTYLDTATETRQVGVGYYNGAGGGADARSETLRPAVGASMVGPSEGVGLCISRTSCQD